MLVALNSNWKIPIGYFLLNGLSGSEKANLINTALTIVYDTGVLVKTLTFDGAASNISMATTLGAKLYPPDMKTLCTQLQTKIFLFFWIHAICLSFAETHLVIGKLYMTKMDKK